MFSFVDGLNLDRAGVTFVQEEDMTSGFATFISITPVDTEPLISGVKLLEEFRSFLHEKRPSTYANLFEKIIWDQRFENLDKLATTATENIEVLKIYMGDFEEKGEREKRFATSLIFPFAKLALKLGQLIYPGSESPERDERIMNFKARFETYFQHVNESIDGLSNFVTEQISINEEGVMKMKKVSDTLNHTERDIHNFKRRAQELLELDYVLSRVVNTYEEVVAYEEDFLTGLVKAQRGIVDPFFLHPTSITKVLDQFRFENKFEKTLFDEKEIMALYNIAEVEIVKDEDTLAVVHHIRLPTIKARGTVYRLESYPVYIAQEDIFVQLKVKNKYFVQNQDSQYLTLTEADINGCKKSSIIRLCDESLWQPRNEDSCESALFFGDTVTSKRMCNYDVMKSKDVLITHISHGEYHISTSDTQVTLPITCREDDPRRKAEHDVHKLAHNNFLTLGPTCYANIAGQILKNLQVDKTKNVDLRNDSTFFDYESMKLLKQEYLKIQAQNMSENDLYNENVQESISDRKEQEKRQGNVTKYFSGLQKIVEEQRVDLQNITELTDAVIEEWSETHEDSATNYTITTQINIVLAILVILLTAIVFYFLKQSFHMTKNVGEVERKKIESKSNDNAEEHVV